MQSACQASARISTPAGVARRPAAKLAACRAVAPQLRAATRPARLQSRARRAVTVRAEEAGESAIVCDTRTRLKADSPPVVSGGGMR
jgi:hypothetical protein